MEIPRFHLAFPVHDLEKARVFYAEILGCEVGRYSDKWIDFNLYGHQIVAHLSPQDCSPTPGEQGTFFITDPSGNNLEFKTFKNDENIFKSMK